MTQGSIDIHDQERRILAAALGAQEWLYFDPVLMRANASPQAEQLQQTRLIDLAANIAASNCTALGPGVYYVKFRMNGMATVNLWLNATFTGGTLTTAAFSTFKDEATQSQAFTGTGAMTTTVQQSPKLAAPLGEQFGVLTLTVGSGGSVTAFTLAEISGQRG